MFVGLLHVSPQTKMFKSIESFACRFYNLHVDIIYIKNQVINEQYKLQDD
jgi:hypothetical protein